MAGKLLARSQALRAVHHSGWQRILGCLDQGHEVESAAATHIGLVRAVNEDAFLAVPGLALVADGMGGHACGDIASALTIQAFTSLADRSKLVVSDVAGAALRANDAILYEASLHPEKSGMGTTISGIAVVDQGGAPHWLVFNIGDSRVYRVSNDSVRQMTVDHSEIAELIASGRIVPEQARSHPLRHVITRSLGTKPAPKVDTWLAPVEPEDRFLICSDGLTGELDDSEIAGIVDAADTLHAAAESLVRAAVMAGGRDNVTVILVEPEPSHPDDSGVDVRTVPRRQPGPADA